jgi:hypothetical protein
MKYNFYVLLLVAFAGCGNPDADLMRDSTAIADSTALIDSLARIPVDSVMADTVAKKIDTVAAEPTYRADFRVLYTYSYCGGARPTEEITTEHNTPKPLTLSTLKFKNHHTGKEYFLKTDAAGKTSGEMEEGKYDVFFTKDINTGIATGFDAKCSTWMNQLLLTIKVTAAGKMQDVNVHFVCNPCDEQSKMRQ